MSDVAAELDQFQVAYKSAIEAWIVAIREEEALVSSAPQSIEALDAWEDAHFKEDDAREQGHRREAPIRRRAAGKILQLLRNCGPRRADF